MPNPPNPPPNLLIPNSLTILFGPIASGKTCILIDQLVHHRAVAQPVLWRLAVAGQVSVINRRLGDTNSRDHFAHTTVRYFFPVKGKQRIASDLFVGPASINFIESLDSLSSPRAIADLINTSPLGQPPSSAPPTQTPPTAPTSTPAPTATSTPSPSSAAPPTPPTPPTDPCFLFTITADTLKEALRRLRQLPAATAAYFIQIDPDDPHRRILIPLRVPHLKLPDPIPFTIRDSDILWHDIDDDEHDEHDEPDEPDDDDIDDDIDDDENDEDEVDTDNNDDPDPDAPAKSSANPRGSSRTIRKPSSANPHASLRQNRKSSSPNPPASRGIAAKANIRADPRQRPARKQRNSKSTAKPGRLAIAIALIENARTTSTANSCADTNPDSDQSTLPHNTPQTNRLREALNRFRNPNPPTPEQLRQAIPLIRDTS